MGTSWAILLVLAQVFGLGQPFAAALPNAGTATAADAMALPVADQAAAHQHDHDGEANDADNAEQAPEQACNPDSGTTEAGTPTDPSQTADDQPCEERRPVQPVTLPPLMPPAEATESAAAEALLQWQPDPLFAASGASGLPRLVATSAEQTETAWLAVKAIRDLRQQWRSLRQSDVERLVCTDLVDFRDLAANLAVPFAFRDQFRGRSWARPSLARVLVAARMRWLTERPDGVVSVGDIAQAGCGQLSYGTLVRSLTGDELQTALPLLRRVLGEPLVQEWKVAADFPLESDRFRDPTTPVLVESRVLGTTEDGASLRVAVRKFRPAGLPTKPRILKKVMHNFDRDLRVLLSEGTTVRHEQVTTWDPTGRPHTVWLSHRVSKLLRRQLVVLSHKPMGPELSLEHLVELRLSNWQPGKPESFGSEVRWFPVVDAEGQPAWKRLVQLPEAGHRSHTSGRDVDVAYQTEENAALHRVAIKRVDWQASWRWLQVLTETAAMLGTPVERIYVGPKIHKLLKRKLAKADKESPLWTQIVRIEDGHDAHHHVRLAPVPDELEAQARAALTPSNLPAMAATVGQAIR